MFRFLLVATLLVAVPLCAQPAIDAPPKAPNPANDRPPFPTKEEQKKLFEETEALMRMTPQQQKVAMRKMQIEMLRINFQRSGFNDVKLQDRIIAFVDEQETSRAKLRETARRVSVALDEKKGMPAREQMNALLNLYLNAAEDAKESREAAIQQLDKEIGWSRQPYLMAFLHLNGIIGETATLTGDVIMLGYVSQGAIATEAPVQR